MKGISNLPPPYYNFIDPKNKDFLTYSLQIKSLAADPNYISCDHRTIEKQIELDNENSQLKDIAFVGRSNVGKSSLVNYVSGI